MLIGTYEVRNQAGALLGSFSHGDTNGHKAIAEQAAYNRAKDMRDQGETCEVAYVPR